MKTILKNGKIYIEKGVFCEALFIDGGVIRAAGTNEEVMAAAGLTVDGAAGAGDAASDAASDAAGDAASADGQGDYKIIDCEGRTVIPGCNDTHLHLMQFCEFIAGVRIEDATSIDMIVERCRDYIDAHPERVRRGLHALGWNQDLFTDEKRMPDRHDLDRISTEIPVVLERTCGHIASMNTVAIEKMLAGNGGEVPVVEDGVLELDAEGYPTGLAKENAVITADAMVEKYDMEERHELLVEGMKYAVSRGYTSLNFNDVGFAGLAEEDVFRLQKDIRDSDRMLLRLRHQCAYNTPAEFEKALTDGEYAHAKEEYPEGSLLTLGPLKLFSDGSLGARTALLSSDYADDPGNKGLVWVPPEHLNEMVAMANEHGIQVITHAIGDQGVRNVLDAYEAADPTGTNPCRNTINHCQITDRECLDRIRDGHILVAVQPIFLEYDIHMAEDRVGPEMIKTSYAFNTMYREGVHQSFGTDAPVEDLNPFANIYTAVTRKDLKCEPAGGWYPDECMDIYDAVDCATYEGAYMEFAEDVKGRLKPGYLADLVILDKDIFTCPQDEIKDILPVMTMVDGKVVYER